ncbi:chalcone isomerase domain-containing protein [Aspergillus ibericus CBS 121593]|uniref:Chalcone isomerase domain-containing protein n=1 Tax=Aspergillus ibericus CBS 121593 TaxID=1448316 RepID=A0A395GTW0_9EURO|nr:hypothetical protein BO80DRAFT_426820 [Aspergillus ibericus CBS 121593]RAK99011.1 hypothetical protein BO80DRAFT_426820 [Aspergillus ibericus CBS 121593]
MPPIPPLQLQLRAAARARTQCLRQSRIPSTPRTIRNTSTTTNPKNPLRTTPSPRSRDQDLARTKRSIYISTSGIILCAVGMYAVIKADVFGLEQTTTTTTTETGNENKQDGEGNGAMKLDGPVGFPGNPTLTIIHGEDGEGEKVETGTSSVPYFPTVMRLPRWIESDDTPVQSGEEIPLVKKDAAEEEGEEYQLLGLGIRTVSFLNFQVYVVGMYVAKSDLAELQSRLVRTAVHPPHVEDGGEKVIANEVGAAAATSLVSMERDRLRELLLDQAERGDEAWEGILKEGGLRTAFRIVPTRNTDFLHLRDGWVRGITGRAKKYNPTSGGEFEGEGFGKAMGEFKGLFSGAGQKNVPKGQTLVLARGRKGQLDVLVWGEKGPGRYMGRVTDERISRLVWMNYLAGKNVSSEGARRSVVDGIMGVVERPVGTV